MTRSTVLGSIVAMFVLLCILWADAASAADTRRTETRNPDGSKTVCVYQSEFATTQDGSHVFRTAWRCETSGYRISK